MGCQSSRTAQNVLPVEHSDQNVRNRTLNRGSRRPNVGSDRGICPVHKAGVSPSSKSIISSQILYNYGINPDQTQNSKILELRSLVLSKAAKEQVDRKDGQELHDGDEDGLVPLTQLRSKLGMRLSTLDRLRSSFKSRKDILSSARDIVRAESPSSGEKFAISSTRSIRGRTRSQQVELRISVVSSAAIRRDSHSPSSRNDLAGKTAHEVDSPLGNFSGMCEDLTPQIKRKSSAFKVHRAETQAKRITTRKASPRPKGAILASAQGSPEGGSDAAQQSPSNGAIRGRFFSSDPHILADLTSGTQRGTASPVLRESPSTDKQDSAHGSPSRHGPSWFRRSNSTSVRRVQKRSATSAHLLSCERRELILAHEYENSVKRSALLPVLEVGSVTKQNSDPVSLSECEEEFIPISAAMRQQRKSLRLAKTLVRTTLPFEMHSYSNLVVGELCD